MSSNLNHTDFRTETEASSSSIPPSMTNATLTGLLTGIITDAQKLIGQQAEMLKTEMYEDFRSSKKAAEYGAVAVVLGTVGAISLLSAITYFLHEQYDMPMWASLGLVGGLSSLLALIFGGLAYRTLEQFNPLPNKTWKAFKETFKWRK